MVVGSKTATYSQAVEHNKTQYNNYGRMVKELIQLDLGDWESYINEIRASLDTTRATEAPTTLGDLTADKVKTSTQTQTSTGKINQEKKMVITPTTRPVKCAMEKSPFKTRSKDRRSPIRPSTSTATSPNNKVLKDKQKTTSKQKIDKTENVKSSNKLRLLEKKKIENSSQLTKHKGHKNKRANSLDLRLNNEPQHNSVELPQDQSQ